MACKVFIRNVDCGDTSWEAWDWSPASHLCQQEQIAIETCTWILRQRNHFPFGDHRRNHSHKCSSLWIPLSRKRKRHAGMWYQRPKYQPEQPREQTGSLLSLPILDGKEKEDGKWCSLSRAENLILAYDPHGQNHRHLTVNETDMSEHRQLWMERKVVQHRHVCQTNQVIGILATTCNNILFHGYNSIILILPIRRPTDKQMQILWIIIFLGPSKLKSRKHDYLRNQ